MFKAKVAHRDSTLTRSFEPLGRMRTGQTLDPARPLGTHKLRLALRHFNRRDLLDLRAKTRRPFGEIILSLNLVVFRHVDFECGALMPAVKPDMRCHAQPVDTDRIHHTPARRDQRKAAWPSVSVCAICQIPPGANPSVSRKKGPACLGGREP